MQTLKLLSILVTTAFMAACTGGQWHTPMTPMTGITGMLPLIFGTTKSGSVRTGGSSFTKNSPQDVQILNSEPDWPFVEVGYVEAKRGPFIQTTGLYEALQWRAAAIGADAVIVSKDFMKYPDYRADFGDDFYTPTVKGRAIAIPKNVNNGQHAVWTDTVPLFNKPEDDD